MNDFVEQPQRASGTLFSNLLWWLGERGAELSSPAQRPSYQTEAWSGERGQVKELDQGHRCPDRLKVRACSFSSCYSYCHKIPLQSGAMHFDAHPAYTDLCQQTGINVASTQCLDM